jgi:CheY-like chemotaxis protein
MTSSIVALPGSKAVGLPDKKKRVLLVDSSRVKRDIRAETMRRLGMDVDCAADISEARCWWRADLYDLVLFHVEEELAHRDKFCDDIRGATPPQQLAFLVGKPAYLSASPSGNGKSAPDEDDRTMPGPDMRVSLSQNASAETQQRWGILEACRRISAVRSVSDARTRAIRERPLPPRDPESARAPRMAEDQIFAQLNREETR